MEEIARVYARSLYEVAETQGKSDVVREQLGAFADAVGGSRDLQVFLFSPYFSTEEKKDGLGRAVSDADPIVTNVLELLVEKHRMPAIFRIRREFDRLWDDAHKLLPVEITSAFALDEKLVEQLSARIGEQTGRTVTLTTTVDPGVIGGIVMRVGNNILDASIRTRLESLRKQVASG